MKSEQQATQVDFLRNIHCVLGLPYDIVNMNEVVKLVQYSAINRNPFFISTPNLNFLITCLRDREFRNSVLDSDLSTADGMPIVWIARLLGIPIFERVSGAGIFERLRQDLNQQIKVYFFGGPDGIAEMACQKLNTESGGVFCAGFESPGFGSIDEMSSDDTIEKINASGADFLVVSLGAKKGQAWIIHNRTRITVPVISHLGAVVNFVAGKIQRAPIIMQNLGLEWLWRIYQEPKLWIRYLNDGLSLCGLMLFKVMPYFIWIQLNKKRFDNGDLKISLIEEIDGLVTIRLSGSCTDKNILPLKQSVSNLALTHKSFNLDLEQVSGIDTAFIGLCMLLYSHTTLQGGKLSLLNINHQIRKTFKWNCAEFLL